VHSDVTEGHLVQLFNFLNVELNPICYLLALLGDHHFLYVSRIRVKVALKPTTQIPHLEHNISSASREISRFLWGSEFYCIFHEQSAIVSDLKPNEWNLHPTILFVTI
jgi:hypothetical protein